MARRTVYCGRVSEEYMDQKVTLKGWVQKRRDLGGVFFIDLRDREGIVQVVFNPEESKSAWEIADQCRSEYVVEITGTVIRRDAGAVNKKMATGDFEVKGEEIVILNSAKTPPFSIEDEQNISDEVRLKYRYMDLRRPKMTQNLMMRHRLTQSVRRFLDDNDFLDYNQAIAMELDGLDTVDKRIEMEERLGRLFEQRSRDGSEDDISISIIFNSDAYESVKQGLETRRKLNKIDEQIGLSKKKIVTLDLKQKQIENERNINIENWKKVALEKSKLKQYSEKLIERRNALEEELKKIEREQDELSKKKIELDSSIKQYEEIEKIKSDEQDKNLADKQKEEKNIQIKEAEKRRLQDILNN